MVAGRHDSLETAPKGTFLKRSKVLSAQNSQVLSAHNSPVNMSKVPTAKCVENALIIEVFAFQ